MKSLLKNLKRPIIYSIITATIFLTYLFTVGIPKTRAAAYYNLAQQQLGLGAISKADEYYREAIRSFPEAYLLEQYLEFRKANF
jgi:hypothetical protein